MDEILMAAVPAQVLAHDHVTVLTTAGPLLTKVFTVDGVREYDDARNFKINRSAVGNIDQLASLLEKLRGNPKRCIIRGDFVGEDKAKGLVEPEKEGFHQRLNMLFSETPHHWLMCDIDKYYPVLYDPVVEPLEAIHELIETQFPVEFHNRTFVWQLSSSAGQKPGLLKVHLWFWSSVPYTGLQWRDYVRGNKLPIDVAPFRRVQVHYTADPIFEEGTTDPMSVRFGFHRGASDVVTVDLADVESPESDDGSYTMIDPGTKPGAIGAVCRAYPVSRVITDVLPDQFEFAIGSDKRVTWLGGGGAPEGAFITDDGNYLGNTHNTDPFENRLTNSFDLIRWFKFGHLDGDLDLVTVVTSRPSYRATLGWAAEDADVRSELGQEVLADVAEREQLQTRVAEASDEAVLRNEVIRDIKATDLEDVDREILARAVQNRFRALTNVLIPIADVRRMLAAERAQRALGGSNQPGWLRPWVYTTDRDRFFNLDSGESVTITGFNMMHDRHMLPFADDDGNVPNASNFCKTVWEIDTVAGLGYMPGVGRVFDMLGLKWANSYSDREVPDMPPVLLDSEIAAIETVQAHIEKMFPDQREREIFTSWLAYNVQHTGKKIRWAPFIYGQPGTGKSFFLNLLGACLGGDNVGPLDATTVCNSDFTAWAVGACVRCLEEAKLHGHNAHDTMNKLKQFITNTIIDVHCKGRDPYRAINVTNYLVLSNYIDGLALDKEDRRYFVLHAGISAAEAVAMADSGYFELLFGAIEQHSGAVRKWLSEYQLHPEFNPDGQAPMTTAKEVTIELGKSDLHLAAEELIERGAEGVSKTVVSSVSFARELQNLTGRDVYTRTVHSILESMGFRYEARIKWKKQSHRVWVSNEVPNKVPNEELRSALDAACFEEEFLK